MTNSHVYLGIENVALTNAQRNTLVSQLQQLGTANTDGNPSHRNHWRVRPDNQAVLFEAVFDENTVTIAAIAQRLADIFGIAVGSIATATQQTQYGLLVTYSRGGTPRLRSIAFGYNNGWPAYSISQAAALQYLADNAAAWGDLDT